MQRLLHVVEFLQDSTESYSIELSKSAKRKYIYRFLCSEYGKCLGRTPDGYLFSKAKVTVEDIQPIPQWRLL